MEASEHQSMTQLSNAKYKICGDFGPFGFCSLFTKIPPESRGTRLLSEGISEKRRVAMVQRLVLRLNSCSAVRRWQVTIRMSPDLYLLISQIRSRVRMR